MESQQNAHMDRAKPAAFSGTRPTAAESPEYPDLRGGYPGIFGDIQYFINTFRIIRSNRRFFYRFYFLRQLPDALQRCMTGGDRMKKRECLDEARETGKNLLESISQATSLAKASIRSSLIRALAVRILGKEYSRYAAIEIPGD
jgi:hypothetical protein